MDVAFGWLGRIVDALLQFVPQLIIVRNTHKAVKWKRGGRVVAIDGGRRTWYWPLLTDIEVHVVARQTSDFRAQVLMTKDRRQVVAGAMVVYWINDIVKAIGERNWDVESTVQDITMSVVVEEVMSRELDALLESISEGREGEFNKSLTENCRSQLRQFGVHVDRASLTDFSTTKVFKIVGGGMNVSESEE